jgi:hypothetical protein
MDGLYKVLEQIGHSFKLKLLESIKVHPVFYAKKLRKDPRNLLLRQTNPEPPLLEVEDSEIEYKVQEVLAVKLIRGKLKYRVK